MDGWIADLLGSPSTFGVRGVGELCGTRPELRLDQEPEG